MEKDAELFKSWDVDYVKLDGCYSEPFDMDEGYIEFGKSLLNTRRPMVYSCSWPFYQELVGMAVNLNTYRRDKRFEFFFFFLIKRKFSSQILL